MEMMKLLQLIGLANCTLLSFARKTDAVNDRELIHYSFYKDLCTRVINLDKFSWL